MQRILGKKCPESVSLANQTQSQINLEMRVVLLTPTFSHQWSMKSSSWMLTHRSDPADRRSLRVNHSHKTRFSLRRQRFKNTWCLFFPSRRPPAARGNWKSVVIILVCSKQSDQSVISWPEDIMWKEFDAWTQFYYLVTVNSVGIVITTHDEDMECNDRERASLTLSLDAFQYLEFVQRVIISSVG